MKALLGRPALATRTAIVCVVLLAGPQRLALANDTWQYEASLAYVTSEEAQAPSAKSSTRGLGVRYYFSALREFADYPLAEAAFAERIGQIGISYQVGKFEDDFVEKHDVSSMALSASLMRPGTDFLLRLSWRETRFSEASTKFGLSGAGTIVDPTSEKIDVNTSTISVGYFVRRHLLVGYGHGESRADIVYQPTSFPPDRFDARSNRLFVQHLGKVGDGQHLASNMLMERVESKFSGGTTMSNSIVAVQGRYYPRRMHGMSLELGRNAGDDKDDEGHWYEIGYDCFVTGRVNLGASFKRFSAKDKVQGEDEKTLVAFVNVRF
jgi:hypothetical protein